MKLSDMAAPVGAYLKNRLAEPESRAAVGAAVGAAGAYMVGQIGLPTLEMAGLAAAVTFALPAPIAQDVLQAFTAKAAPPPPPPPIK